MLDRVRIWDTEVKTLGENEPVQRYIHYELANQDGTIQAHGCIPEIEWRELRANVIRTYPADVSVSKLTDYITVLLELID